MPIRTNGQWAIDNRQGLTNCGMPDYKQTDAGLRINCLLLVANWLCLLPIAYFRGYHYIVSYMQEILRQHFEKIITLTDEEFAFVLSHFTFRKFKKHQFLIQQGNTVKHTF